MKLNKKNQRGGVLVLLIIVIAVFAMVMFPVVAVFLGKMQLMRSSILREQAFQIAEAGINYYQWHMVRFPNDFQDGTGDEGPYVHDYIDYDIQKVIGQFSLEITPPSEGQTTVIVKSTGWTNENPNIKKIVTATFGKNSLANYALLAHDWIYVWDTETYDGPVHSDAGIRFEGTAQSAITSSVQTTYTSDCNQEHPERSCPARQTRPAVWALGEKKSQNEPYWSNPVPTADFTGISAAFSTIMQKSSLPGNINLPSYSPGYSLVFNSDGTVTVSKVLRTKNTGAKFPVTTEIINGTNTSLKTLNGGTDYRDRSSQYTRTIPAEGLAIYSVNNLWVEGTVKGRVVVATANGATNIWNMPNIYIPGDLVYSTTNPGFGPNADTIGLMAQGNIIITKEAGKDAPYNTHIDAALLAQNGFVAAPIGYSGGSAKNNLYIFGSVILHGSWWFNFTNYTCYYGGCVFTDGYQYPHFSWDSNLLYYPPPYFPGSSGSDEIQMKKWLSQ
jgi:hypothetical protein